MQFGQTNVPKSVFGQTTVASSLGGGSVFGSRTAPASGTTGLGSVFGGTSVFGSTFGLQQQQQQAQAQSLPGRTTVGTGISTALATGSVFGSTSAFGTGTPSVFGAMTAPPASSSTAPFVSATKGFSFTKPSSAFSSAPTQQQQQQQQQQQLPKSVVTPPNANEICQKDFTLPERPLWPLSSYGLTKEDPCILVGADVSFEEARLLFLNDVKQTGAFQGYVQDFNQAIMQYAQDSKILLQNPYAQHQSMRSGKLVASQIGAFVSEKIKSLTFSASTVPTQSSNNTTFASSSSVFGGSSSTPTGIFGNASSFGQQQQQQQATATNPQPNIVGSTVKSNSNPPASGFSFNNASAGQQSQQSQQQQEQQLPQLMQPHQQQDGTQTVINRRTDLPTELIEKGVTWNVIYPIEYTLHPEDIEELNAIQFGGRDKGRLIPTFVPIAYRQ
ncbi:hypothetical protein HK100_009551 [Physocladia obscura]|uniref:Uncharacterized protein n=1 Tax=Physocladia obscura TaxID=109957 RepID=A0AAD5XF29_9FUNG|nr:hypothetical protein HK100_009551 [Physocladia obscura]